ncbi:bifunctional diguanylate cyclase/phosphodiesterase [uncultured Cellulomonas sp.]|uniref:putative bifunctional diguanylate cyclase/phosphodiesterase n=1 Tax=uncultured Cellulomonas sp. TaxID=189682 RepID=UPI002607B2A4|nr:bifunctional diguanylate cyclase/phosphodiesterase [uncultured Cellulomonas sp.]
MDLTSSDEDRVAARRPARSFVVGAYVTAVAVLGAVGLALVVVQTDWAQTLAQVPVWAVAFLVLAALIGEIKPLSVTRGDEPAEAVSSSTPFIVALISVGGLGIALGAQLVASVADDVLRRRPATKSLFNLGQYAISVIAGRVVFAALAGHPVFGPPMTVGMRDVLPLLVGGAVLVLVNRLLVAVVVALAVRQPLGIVVGQDARFFAATTGVLLCVGAVAANVASSGVVFLFLLCAPAVAVYGMTKVAVRHAHQATHDSLTGLGNRDRLQTQLTHALAAAADDPAAGPGLVMLDLDHFKDINDTLGHPVGDELLRNVAHRLDAVIGGTRQANRLGGDEFAVVVAGGLVDCEALARDLLAALEAPTQVGELELLVRASAGVAVAPAHGTDAATLMKNADIALYQAKLDRDRTCVYSEQFDAHTLERLGLLADLRAALDTGQLSVAYQPQVDLTDRRTVGVEALVRWRHPVRGQVPPDSFIPLAEKSGLIAAVTAFVLNTALGDLARWRAEGHRLRMAVNLSARHLSDLALPRQVLDALQRHGVPAGDLVLEVTETGLLSDPARADVVIAELRRIGVGIAVDDYGTGHASLNYLKRLEIDELKVDRSFVSDMDRDRHDFVIVRSTITLARDLGLRVIAEGVQEEETAVSLQALGCGIGQGYHLARPTTSAEIGRRLHAEQPRGGARPAATTGGTLPRPRPGTQA